jgi:hypothetical protein
VLPSELPSRSAAPSRRVQRSRRAIAWATFDVIIAEARGNVIHSVAWAVSIPVLTSTKGAAFLINDKECDANHEDDNSDHPENNAHLEVLVQEQQDDTKSNHGVPLYKALYTRE